MNYSQSQILQDVRLTLDQNQVETGIPLNVDTDTLELDDIIKGKVIEAARHILLVAPLRLIDDPKSFETTNVIADENGKASITLPSDYLKLAVMQMDDWKVPVRMATLDDTDIRMMVNSEFEGIRPNEYRPLVVETQVYGKPTLEMYGSEHDAKVLQGQYVQVPSFIDDKLRFPQLLYTALVNYTAGLTAIVLNAPNAMAFINLANQYMGIQQQEQQTKGK